MRKDRTKALLSLIATLTSAVLLLIYWLAPADADSHRLHILLIDCIPDVLVVLVAIPVVYWLFYRRGLTNMGDCPLFTGARAGLPAHLCEKSVPWVLKKTGKATLSCQKPDERDVLVVMDVQRDLVTGSLATRDVKGIVPSVDSFVRAAESRGMSVVFAGYRHASDHGGPETAWCLMDNRGDDDFAAIYSPSGNAVFDVEVNSETRDCSALENPVLDLLLSNPSVHTIYVAGVAPEDSVRATCQGLLRRGKKVIALETAIVTVGSDSEQVESMWAELVERGVERRPHLDPPGGSS